MTPTPLAPPPAAAPLPSVTPRPGRDTAARSVLSLAVLLLGVACALVATFAAWVVWTDCLLGCGSGGDPVAGGLLGLLASGLLAGGVWGARVVWRVRAATVRAGLWLLGGLVVAWALTGIVDGLLWEAALAGCPGEPADRYACADRAYRSWPVPAVPALVLAGAGALAVRAWHRG